MNIRFCKVEEADKLQMFLSEHWKKDHILATNQDLLFWQHFNKSCNRLNYVLALSEEDQILGVLGFIPLAHFDNDLADSKDLWLAIWKTNETNIQAKGAGVLLLEYLIDYFKPKTIGSIGINSQVKRLYKALGFQMSKLNHYYFLNRQFQSFRIADVEMPQGLSTFENSSLIKQVFNFDNIKSDGKRIPYKTTEFYTNRYIEHPFYKYILLGVFNKDNLECIWIVRQVFVENSNCLRIVDIIGNTNLEINLSYCIQSLLSEYNAEYIDCMNYGVDEYFFLKQGFAKRGDDVIIPNFFEPFERRNVDIEFAIKGEIQNYIIFKGDSDQDRPSIIA